MLYNFELERTFLLYFSLLIIWSEERTHIVLFNNVSKLTMTGKAERDERASTKKIRS